MSQTLSGNVPGLMGYWQFDEGAGPTAHDLTPNHNDGSLGGGVAAAQPVWVPDGPVGVNIAGGTLTGTGTINASVLNAGTIDLSPGLLNMTGNYTQTSTGVLDIGVGGPGPGSQFGQLNVSGQATLNGGLDVNLTNGYTPPQGDSYQVVTFASENGNFSAENGLYLGGGEGFSPTFSPSTNPTAARSRGRSRVGGDSDDRPVIGEPLELRRCRHVLGHGGPDRLHVPCPDRPGHVLRGLDRRRHRDAGRRFGHVRHLDAPGRQLLDHRAV